MKFSKVQLGTVQFGLNYGIANTAGKPSYEKARDIIALACERGVTTLDTAAAYGDSEDILGRALVELNLQEQVQIISKVPPVGIHNFSPAEAEKFITESVETSLKRLRRDTLDICLFHREEDSQYLDVLKKLESRGLIKGSGVSLDSTAYCTEVLQQNVPYIQLPYNILDKRFDDFLPWAQSQNISIFSRSLYLQGLLLMPEDRIRPFLHPIIPVRRQLEALAASAGIDMPELCVRYVLGNPAITSILTGVDNLDQLRQNLERIDKGPLPDDLQTHIHTLVPLFPEDIIRPIKWSPIKSSFTL